jgi:hypothetical protein
MKHLLPLQLSHGLIRHIFIDGASVSTSDGRKILEPYVISSASGINLPRFAFFLARLNITKLLFVLWSNDDPSSAKSN